jgi:hypothetical protein
MGDYAVGYGKPPVHTRFRKGQSGNPRGRPRNGEIERARRIVLEEAYRKVSVREGDKVVEISALRAVMRSHLRDALKGNGPNQRAVLGLIKELESGQARAAVSNDNKLAEKPMTDTEKARRINFALAKVSRMLDHKCES